MDINIYIAPLRGLLLGLNYTNEDLEGLEVVAEDKRHTIQIALVALIINVNWYTTR
jgi:hypothetical protein